MKAGARTRRKGGNGSAGARPSPTAADLELEDDAEPMARSHDHQPRCRVPGCGAVLVGGNCPACAFRARHYKAVLPSFDPNCECGAPKKPPKHPHSLRRPKYCVLCTKLRARMKAQGLLT